MPSWTIILLSPGLKWLESQPPSAFHTYFIAPAITALSD
jgi:hypothetical protein